MRPGAHSERIIRLADSELLEEDLGQLAVVVLARMDEHVLEVVGAPCKLGRDRRNLHHVRPRSDHGQNLSARGHTLP